MVRVKITIALIAFVLSSAAQAASLYAITDLGSLGGTASFPFGINDAGQVAGRAGTAGGTDHAFLYTNGTMTDLGTSGGNATASSQAFGLNDAGQVVGTAFKGFSTPVLWSGGTAADLGSGNGLTVARDINNAGQIVGQGGSTGSHAVLYSGGTTLDLGTLGGSTSSAIAINESGQITGYSAAPFGNGIGTRGFLYSGGVMTSLGGLTPDGGSFGYAINDAGVITGTASVAAGVLHAFAYNGGSMTDLGTLGGTTATGWGINNAGLIVGSSTTAAGEGRAFLFDSGPLVDLNSLIDPTSGWLLTRAEDINNLGQIIGQGIFGGEQRSFLLTPIEVVPPAVPEPATWAMFLGGFYMTGAALRRRRTVIAAIA